MGGRQRLFGCRPVTPGLHRRRRKTKQAVPNVFVVGPPGSGKTTLCNEIARLLSNAGIVVVRLSDGEVLLQMQRQGYLRRTQGPILLNVRERSDLYARLAEEVFHHNGDCALVEMAPLTSSIAFRFYPKNLLRKSLLVETVCTFDECRERNSARSLPQSRNFNSFIPEEYIAAFFPNRRQKNISIAGVPKIAVANTRIPLNKWRAQARLVFLEILHHPDHAQ